MPYPSEHAARLEDPKKYKSFARQNGKGGPGVDFIYGVLPSGKTELQAVRFDESKFSVQQAKDWLKEHDMKPMEFEQAIEKSEPFDEGFTADLIVKSATESNGRMYYELGYVLDNARGFSDPLNIISIDAPADSETEFKKGVILKVAASAVEPVPFASSGRFGVSLINPEILGQSNDRKRPEAAKQILQKAEYLGCLLASAYLMNDMAEASILKRHCPSRLSMETEGEQSIIKYEFPFFKDAAKQVVYGVVYEPYIGTNEDTHGDYANADEIEKAAHKFLEEYNAVNFMHEVPVGHNQARVCESYIAPQDFTVNGQLIRKGSWVMATHIIDRELWNMIQSGELNAYSMEGTGKAADFFKHADNPNKVISKRCLFDMIISAVALVDRGANRKKFFLMKRDNPMDKDKILALIKSANLNAEQVAEICKSAGIAEADTEELVKAVETPPEQNDEQKQEALIEKVMTKVSKANTDSIVEALKKVLAEFLPDKADQNGGGQEGQGVTETAPPENASEEEKVAWYLAHPDVDIPDDMVDAVATAMANKKQEEMANA